MAVEEIVGLAPSGSMGSGYNLEAFERGLAANPHFIGQDAGTTDTGPYYHGTGLPFLPLATYRHDMSFMLRGARAQRRVVRFAVGRSSRVARRKWGG